MRTGPEKLGDQNITQESQYPTYNRSKTDYTRRLNNMLICTVCEFSYQSVPKSKIKSVPTNPLDIFNRICYFMLH